MMADSQGFVSWGGLTKYEGFDHDVVIQEGVTAIGLDAFEACEVLAIHAPAGSFAEAVRKGERHPI